MASMSGMALSTERRNRSPGGLGSRPRGDAWSASDTRSCRVTAGIRRASCTQACHAPERSMAGAMIVALARPTSATAARTRARSGSAIAVSIRPIAKRLYAVRQEATPRTSRKYVSSLS